MSLSTKDKEKLLELKKRGEEILTEFEAINKEIQGMGFNIRVQPNRTLFVFRVMQETYGELFQSEEEKNAANAQRKENS